MISTYDPLLAWQGLSVFPLVHPDINSERSPKGSSSIRNPASRAIWASYKT